MMFHHDAVTPNHLKWLKCPSCGFTTAAPKARTRMISLDDWITSSGKYTERADSEELTQEVKNNAEALLTKINTLLEDLGIKDPTVSSGFRPSSVNSKIPNAAKRSAHMSGNACDIFDPENKIGKIIRKNKEMLATNGLMMEQIESTPSWCHLDQVVRKARASNEFIP